MKKNLSLKQNQFLLVNRMAPVQTVLNHLRGAADKSHYAVIETGTGDYAIFTFAEFITEWQQYERSESPSPYALMQDVPLFTAARVSRDEPVESHDKEKRFLVMSDEAVVVSLVVQRETEWKVFSPVSLEDLIEVQDYYRINIGSGVPDTFANHEQFMFIPSKGKKRSYRRLTDDEFGKRLNGVTKSKIIELLNRGHHAGAIDFFEGGEELGLGVNFYSTREQCPQCSASLSNWKDKNRVLLFSHQFAEPQELLIAATTGGSSGSAKRRRSKSVVPEVAPDVQVLPEVAPDRIRGVFAEIAPSVRPEIGPELRPEVAPELIPDKSFEATSDGDGGEKRWINVEIEGGERELIVNENCTLSMDVDIIARHTSPEAAAQLNYRFGEAETEVELEIHLSSQDFRVYDDRRKLYVPRSGRSENKARFEIKPLHGGLGTLKALILKDNNFIQELTLTIEVATGKVKVESKGRPPEAVAIVKSRDLTLWINYKNEQFNLKLSAGKTADAIINLSLEAEEDMAREVRDVWDQIIESKSKKSPIYQVGVDIPEQVNKDSLQKLAKLGFRLYKDLFSDNQDWQTQAMGELLRKFARDESLNIQIISDKFFLPWGLLYMDSNTNEPNAEMFLGMKHVIEHIPKQGDLDYFSLQIDGSPKFSVSLNLDERIDTQAAGKGIPKKLVGDQKAFWARLKAGGSVDTEVREKSTKLLEAIRTRQMRERLIYFYCHASGRMNQPKPSITLGDGKPLTVKDLKDEEGEKMSLPSAPLVFINACESAELSPYFYDDFLNFFVTRGARGAIGTECKIPAVFASEWADRFFKRFLSGSSLGKLFLELRREFYYKHNNLLGLAYALYCDGDTQILPSLPVGD